MTITSSTHLQASIVPIRQLVGQGERYSTMEKLEKFAVRQLSVVDAYHTACPLPLLNLPQTASGVRVPAKRIFTSGGLPVLALYKGGYLNSPIYFFITRQPQGYLFHHFYHADDLVQLTDEEFSLSTAERQEIEKFLVPG